MDFYLFLKPVISGADNYIPRCKPMKKQTWNIWWTDACENAKKRKIITNARKAVDDVMLDLGLAGIDCRKYKLKEKNTNQRRILIYSKKTNQEPISLREQNDEWRTFQV